MLVLPAAIGSFVLVNLLCACIALGVGFAAGVWFFGAKMAKPADAGSLQKEAGCSGRLKIAKRTAERAAMAASQVADLANSVATDVGDHAAKMKAISADLAGIDRQSTGANAAVFIGDGSNARRQYRTAAAPGEGRKATGGAGSRN